MTAPLASPSDWLLDILTRPSVKDLARLYPHQTYVHTIPWSDVLAEEREVRRALNRGGYRKADQIEPHPIAVDALIDDLHDIAFEHGIDGYDVDHAMNANADLEITMVFRSTTDMVLFKLALPW